MNETRSVSGLAIRDKRACGERGLQLLVQKAKAAQYEPVGWRGGGDGKMQGAGAMMCWQRGSWQGDEQCAMVYNGNNDDEVVNLTLD